MAGSSLPPIPVSRERLQSLFLLAAGALALVLVPYLFWQQVWFGRVLSNAEITQYLADGKQPRHIQHALNQIESRIETDPAAARHWYRAVVSLAHHPRVEIRITVAWVMGQDSQSGIFHGALLGLLGDPEPMVRRNAALSLTRFGDRRALPVLDRMLESYPVRAPGPGKVDFKVSPGEQVRRGDVLARLGEGVRLMSPLPGSVKRLLAPPGSAVARGDPLVLLFPDDRQLWESLRALYLLGGAAELRLVEHLLVRSQLGEALRQQANLTAGAIRARVEHQPHPDPDRSISREADRGRPRTP